MKIKDRDFQPMRMIYNKLVAYFLVLSTLLLAPVASNASVDAAINAFFKPIASVASSVIFWTIPGTEIMLVVLWLGLASLFFTCYFGFIQFRKLNLSVETVRGKHSKPTDPGQLTAFQALSTALSGTVGLGNIAGVAVAISIGGPGAMIWMMLLGFMGMATKMVECTLGVRYREIDDKGRVAGGPMHYLPKGLAEVGYPKLGKVLGFAAAVLIILASFGAGNLFQSNQATSQLMSLFNISTGGVWFGLAFAVLVGVVIVGGVTSIAKVTSKLVPFMGIGYVLAGLLIMIMNYSVLPDALSTIVQSAFSMESGVGGLIGAMLQGFKRAAFSSEAGFGTAAVAHSAVKTSHPATEGFVALLEPFIDTVIICSITAFVIVLTGAYLQPGLEGVTMTAYAFDSKLPGFSVVLTFAVVLFAFSTMISWSYYGEIGWKYLFGQGSVMLFKLIFCLMCVMGAAMNLGPAIDLSDASIFALAFINIFGLYFLLPIVKREIQDFYQWVKDGEPDEPTTQPPK